MTERELCKRLLVDFLKFLANKIENDELTLEEMMALMRFFEQSIPLLATVGDLARYYGQSEVSVRSVIHRKLLGKPKRRVMYDFREFARVVPGKWRK